MSGANVPQRPYPTLTCASCGKTDRADRAHFAITNGRLRNLCRDCSRRRSREGYHRLRDRVLAELAVLEKRGDRAAIRALCLKHGKSHRVPMETLKEYAPEIYEHIHGLQMASIKNARDARAARGLTRDGTPRKRRRPEEQLPYWQGVRDRLEAEGVPRRDKRWREANHRIWYWKRQRERTDAGDG